MASPMLRPKAFVLLVPSRVKKILVLHQRNSSFEQLNQQCKAGITLGARAWNKGYEQTVAPGFPGAVR